MFNRFTCLVSSAMLAVLGSILLPACAVAPNGLAESRQAWDDARDTVAYPRDDPGERQDQAELRPNNLDEALHLALLRNPRLGRAFEQWRAAFEGVALAQKLPEPQVSLAVFVSEVETRVGPTNGKLALRQSYPWFGVLELKGDQALARSEGVREQMETVRLEVELSLREVWYELIYLGEAIAVTQAHIQLVDHWEGVARTRYESNLVQQSDLIRVQIELGRLDDRSQTLEDRRVPLLGRLAAIMDVDAGILEGLAPGIEELPSIPAINFEEVELELMANNPDLRAIGFQVKAAEFDRDLSDKAFFPSFSIGGEYTFIGDAVNNVTGSGDDAFALSLGLSIPVWRNAYRAGQRKADSQARSFRLDREGLLNNLKARLADFAFQMRDSTRRIQLYRDNLIPKGEEALQALDSSYQVGRSNYIDLVDAERVLFEFQLQLARANIDRGLSFARIERLNGGPLASNHQDHSNTEEN